VLGLLISGIPFSVSAAIGFIALFGIAVMDGIIILSQFNQLIDEGFDRVKAVIRTGELQMRPVLMTSAATVFGHLARIDVRRGQKVVRGARLGTVGVSGWALSPQLHYEYWRNDGERLRPTDPLFAVLDLPLERKPYSLERMAASWAPGPLDSLPGIDVRAKSTQPERCDARRQG